METKVRFAYLEYLSLAKQSRNRNAYEQRFAYLEFAHILGQQDIVCHLQVHMKMFWLAVCAADWREMAGQTYRLLLTPFGHLLNRLPLGNTGRSNVSPFEPMDIPEELREILTPVGKK